jgi:hypothetical protein
MILTLFFPGWPTLCVFCKGWAPLRCASVLFNRIDLYQPRLIAGGKQEAAPQRAEIILNLFFRGWPTLCAFCKGWATLCPLPVLLNWINPNQPRLIVRIKRKAAPRPLPRMLHQPLHHWIRVNVVQFFFPLRIAPHIEVVKSPLPKSPVLFHGISELQGKLRARSAPLLSSHRSRYALLQYLQHSRHIAFLRLADQQMHVLRHEDVPNQPELIGASDLPQYFQEQIPRANRFQIAPPVVATEGNKMQIALAVVAFQTFRHSANQKSGPPLQNPQG